MLTSPRDLHSHSQFSDGSLSPTALVELAKANHVSMLALTDHDTMAGLPEARAAAVSQGIQLIDGVEISSQWRRPTKKNPIGVHIIALAPKDSGPLQLLLDQQQHIRAQRAVQICQKLEKILKKDPWPDVVKMAGDRPEGVTRSHIASWLVEQHVVTRQQQAFDSYLKEGRRAYVPLAWAELNDVIKAIHASGAQAVLAHPTRYNLTGKYVRYLVGLFKSLGGDAVELPTHHEQPATRHMIDHLVAEHGLAVSTASDFHGDSMPWIKLGNVPNKKPEQRGVWEAF